MILLVLLLSRPVYCDHCELKIGHLTIFETSIELLKGFVSDSDLFTAILTDPLCANIGVNQCIADSNLVSGLFRGLWCAVPATCFLLVLLSYCVTLTLQSNLI